MHEWNLQEFRGFLKKYSEVHHFVSNLQSKLLERVKPKTELKPGYIQNLSLKIIENLRVKINNIHIRVETCFNDLQHQ
jgi:hypothetical protein